MNFLKFFGGSLMTIVILAGIAAALPAELHWLAGVRIFQVPLETITRYEIVIDGERIQCERREDHVRDTVETAC